MAYTTKIPLRKDAIVFEENAVVGSDMAAN